MLTEFKLPAVGENITSGTIVKINVAVGASVKKDQSLLELETDKATIEVPSPSNGTIKDILIKEGQQVKIGQVVMKIEASGAGGSSSSKTAEVKASPTPAAQAAAPTPVATVTEAQRHAPIVTPSAGIIKPIMAQSGNVAAAPSVRRFAREIGIDINQVPGSGPKGRISLDDVKGFSKQLNLGGGRSAGPVHHPLPDFSKWGSVERKPMNNIRKKTAEHLSYAWATIPHVTQFDKADITELEKLRKKLSTPERKLTITPFLLKVMASALKKFPQFNTSVDMTTSEVVYKSYCNIGVAVDTDRGLLVPVIRDVDKKSIMQLTKELNEMAERARTKKTTLEELNGGCFTLTNLGGIGGTYFTPIINSPEVAILGTSRGQMEQVYVENNFVPRFMLPLSLSYDHRVIDGADGARFLRFIVEAIQQPFLMEVEG